MAEETRQGPVTVESVLEEAKAQLALYPTVDYTPHWHPYYWLGQRDAAARLGQPSEVPPVMVKEIKYPDGAGGMTLKLSHGVVPFMASEFVKFFKDSGGVNYVEFTLVDGKSPEMGPFTVTIQRMMGKTPGMVVAELRDRISELEKAGAK